TSVGSAGVAMGSLLSAGQNARPRRRSSWLRRSKNCVTRRRFPARTKSWSGSSIVLAIRLARTSRSRLNQRSINLSTSGSAAYAKMLSATSRGMTNRSDRRIDLYTQKDEGVSRLAEVAVRRHHMGRDEPDDTQTIAPHFRRTGHGGRHHGRGGNFPYARAGGARAGAAGTDVCRLAARRRARFFRRALF